jgi:hypothetical protein
MPEEDWLPDLRRRNPQSRSGKNSSYNFPKKSDKGELMPRKGYKQTEEHIKKANEPHRGKNHFLWGKHHSKETIKKISETKKGSHPSHETKEKMSKAHKGEKNNFFGKHHTFKARKKMSKAHKGKKLSEETRKKLSESHRGEKGSGWKGGISFEPYSIDWTKTLKRSIRERDHYICQVCWNYGNAVHHIDYNKKNCNPENLITLCILCNLKVNHNRKKWKRFFMQGNLLRNR